MYPDKVKASNLYFAVIEGEDEQVNPIYSEPKKLGDFVAVEIEKNYNQEMI